MISSRFLTATLVLFCLQPLRATAASIEDFSGYKAGEVFMPGEVFPAKGTGWLDGWRSANSYVQVTGSFVTTKPLVDAGPYLAVSIDSIVGEHPSNPSGTVTLPYRPPTKPFKLIFKFRPETSVQTVRYYLFDNDVRIAGPGPLASWLITSKDGQWQLLNGEGNGVPSEMIATGLPVVAGTTYSFAVEVNPQARTWNVTITDGKRSVTEKNLYFRNTAYTPDRCLVFGANETSAPALGLNMRFAIDSISIQP
ncbi:hypothetical protein [Rariglobus hedericola]|uniref:DUF1080 domain-containing protein n=1 Tax=Rariglobus hedericola TaxID=2597822 RepID=A0A556QJI5_9BACT|nr:hypothetical protein [Rariglobus hedericola]TSJ76799.1 hypothetical protein FPL22_11800 [Rariglobus hedericola]